MKTKARDVENNNEEYTYLYCSKYNLLVYKTVQMKGIMGTVIDLSNPVICTKVLTTNNP
jgi:hypothetical protein